MAIALYNPERNSKRRDVVFLEKISGINKTTTKAVEESSSGK